MELVALVVAAFAGSVVFGITGFGAALVTVPFATHFVPLPFALALFVLMDLANAFRIGFENPKHAVKSEWTRLVPTILVGTVAGVTLLVNLPRQAATLSLGVFVFLFALYSLFNRAQSRIVSTRWAYLAGFAGGITSTLFGAGGPPYAMYLSHRGLAKEQYRATMGFATLTSISLRTIAFLRDRHPARPQGMALRRRHHPGRPRRPLGGRPSVPANFPRDPDARGGADASCERRFADRSGGELGQAVSFHRKGRLEWAAK